MGGKPRLLYPILQEMLQRCIPEEQKKLKTFISMWKYLLSAKLFLSMKQGPR
jgi:hypothetical protein